MKPYLHIRVKTLFTLLLHRGLKSDSYFSLVLLFLKLYSYETKQNFITYNLNINKLIVFSTLFPLFKRKNKLNIGRTVSLTQSDLFKENNEFLSTKFSLTHSHKFNFLLILYKCPSPFQKSPSSVKSSCNTISNDWLNLYTKCRRHFVGNFLF